VVAGTDNGNPERQADRRRDRKETVEAYLREPQTEEELSGLDRQTRKLVEEETWPTTR
jgi:hypothetical protein